MLNFLEFLHKSITKNTNNLLDLFGKIHIGLKLALSFPLYAFFRLRSYGYAPSKSLQVVENSSILLPIYPRLISLLVSLGLFLFLFSSAIPTSLAQPYPKTPEEKRNPQENVNLLRFATDLTSFLYDYPLAFHGIGEEKLNQPEDYKAQYYTLELWQRLKLLENFYLKFQYEHRFYNIIETKPGGILASGQILGSESKDLVSRVGASIDFDSRDNRMSPLTGGFYNVSLLVANNFWGQYKMIDLRMDLRQYFALSYRSVLGVQAIVQSITGEVPFHMLAEIGNSRTMRGFNTGQYRDKKLLLFQTEYRFPIVGRVGGVVFSSVGDVNSNFRNFDWREFKSSVGVGLRYNIFKGYRAKLRLDYGISNEGNRRFYIHLAEAF